MSALRWRDGNSLALLDGVELDGRQLLEFTPSTVCHFERRAQSVRAVVTVLPIGLNEQMLAEKTLARGPVAFIVVVPETVRVPLLICDQERCTRVSIRRDCAGQAIEHTLELYPRLFRHNARQIRRGGAIDVTGQIVSEDCCI